MQIYRNILKRALSITFNYKPLWFFGVFVSFLGLSGEYVSVLRAFQRIQQGNPFQQWWNDFLYEVGVPGSVLWQAFKETLIQDPLQLVVPFLVLLAILVVVLFIIWLIIVSQGGLIKNVADIHRSKASSFADNLKSGIDNFKVVFGLNVIERIGIYILIMLIGVTTFLTSKFSALFIPVFLIIILALVALIIIFSFIIKYAICYTVITKKGFNESCT